MKVLAVEDDPDILELLKTYFEVKGHEVVTADNGVSALECFGRSEPDLILLDIVLPRLDGWSVLEAVRATSKVPVILLTSLDDTEDVVRGLAMGADDYLRKPFEVRELDARIQARLRRQDEAPEEAPVLDVGPLRIDDRAKRVTLEGREITLSPKEFELLKLLASDCGRVFSNEEIITRIWSDSSRATSDDVKQYVHLLRNKVGRGAERIRNVKGFGYKLVL